MTLAGAPYVSVVMVTFNHEAYISQAIESVLDQSIPFSYELLIGEDKSTDSTARIVAEYADRYPDLIRPLFAEHNLGTQQNFVRTLRSCRGRYVALLDGDDYWLSPGKLRKQVGVLDSYAECAICGSRARVVYEDGRRDAWDYPMWDTAVFTLPDLLRENFIPSCTSVFRLGLLLDLPEWFQSLPFPDWGLHALLAQYGDIVLLPETLAAYRIHGRGLWSQQTPEEAAANRRAFYRAVGPHFSEKPKSDLEEPITGPRPTWDHPAK